MKIHLREIGQCCSLKWLLIMGFFIFIVLLGLSWAGIRQDSQGNTISQDVASSSGALHIFASNKTEMVGIVGEAATGVSSSSSGSELYSGVYAMSPGYPAGILLH